MLPLNDVLMEAFKIEVAPTTTGGITAFIVFEDGLSDTDRTLIINWVENLNRLQLFRAKANPKIPTTVDGIVYNMIEKTVSTICNTLNNIPARS